MKVNKKYKLEDVWDKPNMVYAEHIDRIMMSNSGTVFMEIHNKMPDTDIKDNVIVFKNFYELVYSISVAYPNELAECLAEIMEFEEAFEEE